MHIETNDELTTQSTPDQAKPGTEPGHKVVEEVGGINGLEPTRYGDWEKNGRCIDF